MGLNKTSYDLRTSGDVAYMSSSSEFCSGLAIINRLGKWSQLSIFFSERG